MYRNVAEGGWVLSPAHTRGNPEVSKAQEIEILTPPGAQVTWYLEMDESFSCPSLQASTQPPPHPSHKAEN